MTTSGLIADQRVIHAAVLLFGQSRQAHDLPIVRQLAQQVIWLHQGKVSIGPAAELLAPERMAQILELEIS
jgi:ABC-type microcin C transport system duplicated ATPase subunit YejF